MAIEFYAGLDSLLAELQEAGLEPLVVSASGGKRPRAAEVKLKEDDLSVHWDRDSHSVWVEGPWDRAAKVERMMKRRRTKRRLGRRLSQPLVAATALVLLLTVAVALFEVFKVYGGGSKLAARTDSPVADSSSASADAASP